MFIEGIDSWEIPSFGGSVGGSASAEGKTDGSSRVEAEAHVSRENDDGSRVSGSVGGSIERDKGGKYTAGGKAEVSWEKPFFLKV